MAGSKFELPKLHHISVAVKDMDKAAEHYTNCMGIGPFMFFDVDLPEVKIYGKPTPLKLKVGIAQMGEVLLELVQALEEGSAPWNLVYGRGEGLYHLGYLVDNLEETSAYLMGKGMELVEEGGSGHNQFAFFSGKDSKGVILEFMQLEPGLLG